jgi:EAL domain-containing protein (putative c-di-GMP-specific phosphodiesterase class I)
MKFKFNLFGKKKKISSGIYSVYQPIVDIATWDIKGYEALVRSEKETPLEMFQKSYEDGTVVPFDFHCLEAAIGALPNLAEGQYLFLNIESPTLEQAFDKGKKGEVFLDGVKEYSEKIVFELAEGVKRSDFEFIRRGVTFIRSLGYRFALDDLTEIGAKTFQMASLRPDFFKIDLRLVRGIADNHVNQQIVKEMVHLGRMNGSEMVAEGVENKEDYKYIRNMGIRYGQGFYFARPEKELLTYLEPPEEART